MKKKRVIAETGAGQHGVATATVAALFGLECEIFMGDEDIKRQSINVFKMKLLGKSVILYCTHCEHDWIAFIGALPDKVTCARCGSTLITMPPERYRVEAFKLYKKTKLSAQEKIWKDKLDKMAAVISASGKKGVIALSTYGIGPTKSVGVLGKKFATENEFFAALLEAQKTFIRTKRYWEFH